MLSSITVEMKQSKQSPEITNAELFEKIYRYAKQKNEQALSDLLATGVCIDLYDKFQTPIDKLAAEGDKESVEFLLSKFNDNLNNAVRGAACGGHLALVENLVARGAVLKYAVFGAARGNYLTLVNNLLGRGAEIDYAAWGASYGGHFTLANHLIVQQAGEDYVVEGAAYHGHLALVDNLLGSRANISEAVRGAATGNHLALVNDLIARGANLKCAVESAAFGNHLALVNNLFAREASLEERKESLDYAVQGAAIGGLWTLVNDFLIQKASLDKAVCGAALFGHFKLVENLIGRGADIEEAVEGASDGGYLENEKITLRTLVAISDEKVRREFAKEAEITDSILAKSTQINRERISKNLSFNQVLALKEPDSAEFFLQQSFFINKKNLPQEIFHLIATYLTYLTDDESFGLSRRVAFVKNRAVLVSDLKIYCRASSYSPSLFHNNQRASLLTVDCMKSKSEKDLYRLLTNEQNKEEKKHEDQKIALLQKEDPYPALIATHIKRLAS